MGPIVRPPDSGVADAYRDSGVRGTATPGKPADGMGGGRASVVDRLEWLTFNTALWLEGPANGFVMWGLVAAWSPLAAWQRMPLLAATLFLGFGVLYLNIFLGWLLWPRPRSDLIADGLASRVPSALILPGT